MNWIYFENMVSEKWYVLFYLTPFFLQKQIKIKNTTVLGMFLSIRHKGNGA